MSTGHGQSSARAFHYGTAGHHEWLRRKLYEAMSAIYGVANNPLPWFDDK